MGSENAVPEIWTYAGKRLTTDKKLVDCWQDPQNNILLYKKTPGLLCGQYEMQVERIDGAINLYGQPRWQSHMNYAFKEEWTVADVSARNAHTRHLREKRAAKGHDSLDVAMERLLPYARACRTRDDKDALIATVLRRLTETW